MVNNILYVFDESADYEKSIPHLKEGTIYLCPITTHQDIISLINRKSEINNVNIFHVKFNVLFHEKAFAMREEYVRFIAEIANKKNYGGKNLKQYFKFPFRDFSVWWFSLISEKNPLKSDSYHNLVKLVTLMDIQKKYSCNYIVVDIKETNLANSIEDQGKNLGFKCINLKKIRRKSEFRLVLFSLTRTITYLSKTIFKIIILKIVMGTLQNRKSLLNKSLYLLVTYFPNADPEKLRQQKFVDKYYEPFQMALEEKGINLSWIAMNIAPGSDWKKSIELGKEINDIKSNLIFCEELLSVNDFFTVLLVHFFISIKSLMIISRISAGFRYPSYNLNIWSLFRNDWYDSFSGTTLMQGIQFYLYFRRAFVHIKKETTVAYLAEMLSWEKALNIAAKERGVLRVVGIQHTTIPLLYLTHFNDRTELIDHNYINNVPRPKYIACAGRIPAEILSGAGWNEVFIWGAIRYQHLKKYIDKKTSWETRENCILVALTYDMQESIEMLSFVHEAFKDQTKYKVMIKGHPYLPVSKVLESSKMSFESEVFKVIETPLYDLLPRVKVMVVGGSSASLEAVACQCPVIIPMMTNVVDMNPLSGISDIPIYVESPDILKKVAYDTIESKDSPLPYEKCKIFIENYFEFLKSNDEFEEKLEMRLGSKT